MNKNDYFDNLKNHHQNLLGELSREDGKSERLFTLITAIFTVSLLAIVYFATSKIDNTPKWMALSSLIGFAWFLFYSLAVCGTSLFDIIYEKEFVTKPFRTIVQIIGELLLLLSPKKIIEQKEIHAVKDRLLHEISDFEENEFNSKYKEFLQSDNKWKTYLIGIKHRVRRWGVIFFGFSIGDKTFALFNFDGKIN